MRMNIDKQVVDCAGCRKPIDYGAQYITPGNFGRKTVCRDCYVTITGKPIKTVIKNFAAGLRIDPNVKKSARNIDEDMSKLNAAIKDTCIKGKETQDAEKKRLHKLMYPNWGNLDAGNCAIYTTDTYPFIKLIINNKDYPGVCILKVDNLIAELVKVRDNFKKKMNELKVRNNLKPIE